jgi:AcrR family transcriptional regulator
VRRPLVLDAALAVWAEHGYRGTTMAAIAAQAKVSKPVLYECFDTKDAVLRALLDREERRLVRATQQALDVDASSDLRTTVSQSYEAFFAAVLAHPVSWRVVFDAQGVLPQEIENRYRAARAAFVRQIAELVRTLTTSGKELTDAEATVLASNLARLAEDNATLLLSDEGNDWTPATLAAFVTRVALDAWS